MFGPSQLSVSNSTLMAIGHLRRHPDYTHSLEALSAVISLSLVAIGRVVHEIWRWIRGVCRRRKAPLCEFCGLKKVVLGKERVKEICGEQNCLRKCKNFIRRSRTNGRESSAITKEHKRRENTTPLNKVCTNSEVENISGGRIPAMKEEK